MSWAEAANTVLKNEHVVLRPVTEDDREPFRAIAFDPDIWRYFVNRVANDDDLDALVDGMLADLQAGRRAVFCIIDRPSGRLAGSSSYGLTAECDGRLEIGWSWLGRDFRGGTETASINRNAKFLLLTHAFEVLRAERVEFKTDELNERVRRGLRAIGAREEGTLRSFNPMPDGRRRNAVFYSILRSEWPGVRPRLAGTLVRRGPATVVS